MKPHQQHLSISAALFLLLSACAPFTPQKLQKDVADKGANQKTVMIIDDEEAPMRPNEVDTIDHDPLDALDPDPDHSNWYWDDTVTPNPEPGDTTATPVTPRPDTPKTQTPVRPPRPTPTPSVILPPAPTATPLATPRPIAKPTATPVARPTATPVAAPTATPVATPSATPVAAPTATPAATPIATPVATPAATPVATPKPTPRPTPPPTPVPTPRAPKLPKPPDLNKNTQTPNDRPAIQVRGFWDEKVAEGKDWTQFTIQALEKYGRSLIKSQPTDIASFCPTYTSLRSSERVDFWVKLVSALAANESDYRPQEMYTERFADRDGNKVVSRGLLQISIESANSYDCGFEKPKELHDPKRNITCAIRIMSRWVAADNRLAGHDGDNYLGIGRYWSPFRSDSKKFEKIRTLLRKVPVCRTRNAP